MESDANGQATQCTQTSTKQYEININGEKKKLDLNVWDTPGVDDISLLVN